MASKRHVEPPAIDARRLRKSIADYCEAMGAGLRSDDREIFRHLADDRGVIEAFGLFGTHDGAALILHACVEARELARGFKRWAENERRVPERMDKLEKAIANLRSFVAELARGPVNILAASIQHDPRDWNTMRRGLQIISDDIARRRQIARETLLRIGATRKLAGESDTKAIGWLAKSIQRITGEPHTRQVTHLATVVLELEEPCSSDRVTKARKLLDKEWRLPGFAAGDDRGKRI